MTWERRYTRREVETSVDVDLDDFDERELLQQLIDVGWLTEAEAVAITARASKKTESPVLDGARIDAVALDDALADITCGRRQEALIRLERALGREWVGRLA